MERVTPIHASADNNAAIQEPAANAVNHSERLHSIPSIPVTINCTNNTTTRELLSMDNLKVPKWPQAIFRPWIVIEPTCYGLFAGSIDSCNYFCPP